MDDTQLKPNEEIEKKPDLVGVEEYPISEVEAKKFVGVGDFGLPIQKSPLDDLIGKTGSEATKVLPQSVMTETQEAKVLETKAKDMLKDLSQVQAKSRTSTNKSKVKSGGAAIKMALAAVLVVIMGAGGVVGLKLTSQSTENRSQAENNFDKNECTGCSPSGFEYKWLSQDQKCVVGSVRCEEKNVDEAANTKESCKARGGAWCAGCGGFCNIDPNKGCNTMQLERCGEQVVYGANYVVAGTESCPADFSTMCDCGRTKVCFDRGTDDQCGGLDGLCMVYSNSSQSSGGKVIYQCDKDWNVAGIPSLTCDDSTGGKLISEIPDCFCGTIQVDIPGQGHESYTDNCGCDGGNKSTPDPESEKLSCNGLEKDKIAPALGDIVEFSCSGSEKADYYEFRYRVGAGNFNSISVLATDKKKAELTIVDSGTYTVQCRVCQADNTCTAWGLAK